MRRSYSSTSGSDQTPNQVLQQTAGSCRLSGVHSSLGPAAAELHCSFAETMVLRPGITSIFESHERGSLPKYSIADFRRLVYTVAASQDWRVASIAAAGITPNFHFAKLESPHRSIFILGHSNYPIVAFAKQVNDVDQRLQFVDESEISSEISRLFPDVAIANGADLNRSITEDDLAQLAPTELRQVKCWKPCTIGQLAFNWWD